MPDVQELAGMRVLLVWNAGRIEVRTNGPHERVLEVLVAAWHQELHRRGSGGPPPKSLDEILGGR
jgi:hypothetical protein